MSIRFQCSPHGHLHPSFLSLVPAGLELSLRLSSPRMKLLLPPNRTAAPGSRILLCATLGSQRLPKPAGPRCVLGLCSPSPALSSTKHPPHPAHGAALPGAILAIPKDQLQDTPPGLGDSYPHRLFRNTPRGSRALCPHSCRCKTPGCSGRMSRAHSRPLCFHTRRNLRGIWETEEAVSPGLQ